MRRYSGRACTVLLLASFACIVIGVRWAIIHAYATPVPFWDQWDGEAFNVYAPYVSGQLTWARLLEPHNEHRILTTRLFVLGLFLVNGGWNPLLEMMVNAVIHVGALVLLLTLLRHATSKILSVPAILFCIVLFTVPYAWENTLAGFQTQFYFNLLFTFISLWWLISAPVFSLRWWLGAVVAVVAFFSLASGLFAAVAAAAVLIVRGDGSRGSVVPRLVAASILVALFGIGYALTPAVPQNLPLKAKSLWEFQHALADALSWPLKGQWIKAFALNAPGLAFIYMMLKNRRVTGKPGEWFLFSLLLWVWGQAFVLAYGRAGDVLSSRYLDLLAIGLLANLVALVWLKDHLSIQHSRRMGGVIAVWIIVCTIGMANQRHRIEGELAYKQRIGRIELANVRGFLGTGDTAYILGKPLLDIPYPRPDRLLELLRDPVIRRILPAATVPDTLSEHRAGRLDGAVDTILAHARLVIILGALGWILVTFQMLHRPSPAVPIEEKQSEG